MAGSSIDAKDSLTRFEISLYHPGCWSLEVTKDVDVELFQHTINLIGDDAARGHFTAVSASAEELDSFLEEARSAEHSKSIQVLDSDRSIDGVSLAGKLTKDLVVDYGNTIADPLLIPELVLDGPIRIADGKGHWTLILLEDRQYVASHLEKVREEADATIEIERIAKRGTSEPGATNDLTRRQREVYELARDEGYYSWPREVDATELAAELDITKSTFLEHLHKAESKLLGSG